MIMFILSKTASLHLLSGLLSLHFQTFSGQPFTPPERSASANPTAFLAYWHQKSFVMKPLKILISRCYRTIPLGWSKQGLAMLRIERKSGKRCSKSHQGLMLVCLLPLLTRRDAQHPSTGSQPCPQHLRHLKMGLLGLVMLAPLKNYRRFCNLLKIHPQKMPLGVLLCFFLLYYNKSYYMNGLLKGDNSTSRLLYFEADPTLFTELL